jgi:UDP-N-acetylmuramoylalanine--D-glutamate ligase
VGVADENIMEGTKHAPAKLGRVLVLGLGKSGAAVARYCLQRLGGRVQSVTVYAGAATPASSALGEELTQAGARVLFDAEDVRGAYDVCIASPGISQFGAFYRTAEEASQEVVSEVEFAWRESAADATWVAITGTNGKTTTTALCAHLLRECGMDAAAVGNIGDTCLAAVAAGSTGVYVAEVSSYQLASTRAFAPEAAVLLNITPDHVKWHQGYDNYVAAKMKVLDNLAASHGVAVLDATNDAVRDKVRELRTLTYAERGFAYVPLGAKPGITADMRAACGSDNAAFMREDDGMLVVALDGCQHDLCTASQLQIPGAHNVGNALAAAAAALAIGAPADGVRRGLQSFKSLEHRIEACGVVNGVEFYNDSKATNVDATLKALAAFAPRKPIVLLGGRDKGTALDVLVRTAGEHCKSVVCYGEGGPRFREAFAHSDLPVHAAAGMRQAFEIAVSLAVPGDIVLLSPACASFDEFSCFEERGDAFKRYVGDLATG